MGKVFRLKRRRLSAKAMPTLGWVMRFAPATQADALKLLRARYPNRPLSARLAAIAFLMRQDGARQNLQS